MRTQYDHESWLALKQVPLHLFRIETGRVQQVLEEYVDFYRKYSNKVDKNDFKLFLGGVVQKIAHCLETPYKIDLEWLE